MRYTVDRVDNLSEIVRAQADELRELQKQVAKLKKSLDEFLRYYFDEVDPW